MNPERKRDGAKMKLLKGRLDGFPERGPVRGRPRAPGSQSRRAVPQPLCQYATGYGMSRGVATHAQRRVCNGTAQALVDSLARDGNLRKSGEGPFVSNCLFAAARHDSTMFAFGH